MELSRVMRNREKKEMRVSLFLPNANKETGGWWIWKAKFGRIAHNQFNLSDLSPEVKRK